MSTLGSHRRELSYCATCPKLCRFACPVGNVEARETVTPWGKMTAAYEHLTEARPLDPSAAEATYACTGCMRCRTHCRHGNEVGLSLFAARAEAVRARVAPAAVARLKARYAQEAPLGASLQPVRSAFSTAADRHKAIALFPGCSALTHRPAHAEDSLFVLRALGVEANVDSSADLCCGYPLLAAGFDDEFKTAATRFRAATKRLKRLVVTDPGCAWTLGVAYAKFGIGVEFEVSPWVSEVVDRIGAAGDKPRLELQASYHDACYLGRGLGEYDAPRRILARVVEGTVGEAVEKREDAGCSGGGGLLPATRPEASKRMAEELARELGAPGRTVVTACPTAMRSFTDSGADAADLAGVVAQWLRQGSR